MYIERNMVKSHDGSKDFDDSDDDKDNEGNYTVWVISKDVNVVTPYTYDEAISLAGHGCYTVGLLGACCLSLLAMSIDIFGFSTIITSSAIATAYVWGYISDTRGRRLSLIIAMWGSFIATTLSAFSPNWMVSAALKFISVSFCSGAQSAAYTLIGECCPISVKRSYLFVLSCSFHVSTAVYTALGYVSLNASFSINLGYLTFTPWRLLVLCFGLPLGISAVVLHFFYESPKFLANIGNKRQALENLRGIWKRNRCIGKKYPVEKLILEEEYTAKTKSIPLLQSMWEQTLPLFKMPFVLRTLQLYFLNIVLYS
ncbi:putative SV2-like protein 1, partial [Operophtera brumata]